MKAILFKTTLPWGQSFWSWNNCTKSRNWFPVLPHTVKPVRYGHSFGRPLVIYGKFPKWTFNLISYHLFIRSLFRTATCHSRPIFSGRKWQVLLYPNTCFLCHCICAIFNQTKFTIPPKKNPDKIYVADFKSVVTHPLRKSYWKGVLSRLWISILAFYQTTLPSQGHDFFICWITFPLRNFKVRRSGKKT